MPTTLVRDINSHVIASSNSSQQPEQPAKVTPLNVDRPARGCHRAHDRLLAVGSVGALFARVRTMISSES